MPFAWTARPLFRSAGDLDTNAEFSTIYRQETHKNSDEDLLKILNDFRKCVISLYHLIIIIIHIKITLYFLSGQRK